MGKKTDKHKSYLEQEGKKEFTNREIRKALKVNPSNQKRYNLSLIINYYIKKVQGKKGSVYYYQIVSYEEFKQLRNHINNVLDDNIKKLEPINKTLKKEIKQFTSPLEVQTASEPVK